MEADINDVSMGKIYKLFPEITALLIGNEPAKVNGECERNFIWEKEKLEAHSSKFNELVLSCRRAIGIAESQNETSRIFEKLKYISENLSTTDGFINKEHASLGQGTSIKDLSLAKMEVKYQNLNSDVVSRLPVAEERSMLSFGATSAVKRGALERQKNEMGSQDNSALSEEDSVLSLNGLNKTARSKEDDVLNECAEKSEVNNDAKALRSKKKDRFEVFVMAKKNVISGQKEMIQLNSDLDIAPSSTDCMVIKASFDETGSGNNNDSQLSGDRPFQCNVCSINFEKERHLIAHQSVHKDERPFTCNTCGKRFKRSDTLGKHQQTHVGLKCYMCEICGKSYVSKFVLKRHQVVHSDERPFACDLCDRKFRIRYDLTVHKRRHIDDKPFSCKECGKKFTNSAHVATHMLIHKNERSFVCGVCSKSFLRKEHLARHFTNVHVGERNYICDICKKRFKRPEVLKAHLLTHGKREDFVCKQCGKSYTTRWNLKAHTFRHKNKDKLHKVDKVCSEVDA